MNRRESGYSLVEILVVIGMIGVISLVTIPNFIAMQHSGKLKSSLRNFVGDVRAMRQRAVTRHVRTKISFVTGTSTTAREYTLAEFNPTTSTWTPIGRPKSLEESCYVVSSTGFTDVDSDGTLDIVFKNDGALDLPVGSLPARAILKTDWKIQPYQYTVEVTYAGAVKTS